jgi:tRNA A-37 threonylcarbamoyl transferase component Bud32
MGIEGSRISEVGHGIEAKQIRLNFNLPPGQYTENQGQRWHTYTSVLERYINDPNYYLDEGGAAKVFAVGESEFCIKLLLNRHRDPDAGRKYDLGNSVSQEGSFLKRMADLNVKGVRTPVLYDVLAGDRYAAIVMEQLRAANLQKVLIGKEDLPDAFEYDRFFDALDAYVVKMHAERDVAHGDLYARNIMIDHASGEPRIIDFGRSKSLDKVKDRETVENDDWARFEEVLRDTKTFLDKREK